MLLSNLLFNNKKTVHIRLIRVIRVLFLQNRALSNKGISQNVKSKTYNVKRRCQQPIFPYDERRIICLWKSLIDPSHH
jgi:hypothetical protein